MSRHDSLSECVCVCRAAYASSSDGFPVSYQCLICQGKLQQVCVCVCVFSASRRIILSLMSRNMLFPADSLTHTNSLSLPSFNPLKSFLSFFLFFFFPLKLFLPPPHPNHSWLNQLQNEVKQLHVAKLLMWNDSDYGPVVSVEAVCAAGFPLARKRADRNTQASRNPRSSLLIRTWQSYQLTLNMLRRAVFVQTVIRCHWDS